MLPSVERQWCQIRVTTPCGPCPRSSLTPASRWEAKHPSHSRATAGRGLDSPARHGALGGTQRLRAPLLKNHGMQTSHPPICVDMFYLHGAMPGVSTVSDATMRLWVWRTQTRPWTQSLILLSNNSPPPEFQLSLRPLCTPCTTMCNIHRITIAPLAFLTRPPMPTKGSPSLTGRGTGVP